MKTAALVTLRGAILLIPLSPLFIFGLGPIGGFGVAGAGIAVTIYYSAACIVLLRYLSKGGGGLRLGFCTLRWTLFREILSVGVVSSFAVF